MKQRWQDEGGRGNVKSKRTYLQLLLAAAADSVKAVTRGSARWRQNKRQNGNNELWTSMYTFQLTWLYIVLRAGPCISAHRLSGISLILLLNITAGSRERPLTLTHLLAEKTRILFHAFSSCLDHTRPLHPCLPSRLLCRECPQLTDYGVPQMILH